MDWKKIKEEGLTLSLKKLVKISLLQVEKKKRNLYISYLARRNKGKLVLKEVQGSLMYLNTDDKGVSADLLIDGIREPMSTNEFKKRLKPRMVVVDIGANIGYYALLEAKAVGPTGMVYAIEPVLENVLLLRKNVELNNYKNVLVFQKAIGGKCGEMDFFLSSNSNLGSVIETSHANGKAVKVEVTTLGRLLRNKRAPDYIRMDVEGYEYETLKGMEDILSKPNKMGLFIEVHGEFIGRAKTLQLLKLLKGHGFLSCRIIHEPPNKMRAIAGFVSKDVVPKWGQFTKRIDDMIREEGLLDGVFQLTRGGIIFTEKKGMG